MFIDGQLQTRMLRGPSSFDQWCECWKVFRSSLIMLGACKLATLDAYEEDIIQLMTLFPSCWHTMSTVDELLRSEPWDTMLEQALANQPPEFDSELPWDWVIRSSCYGLPRAEKNHWWVSRVAKAGLDIKLGM